MYHSKTTVRFTKRFRGGLIVTGLHVSFPDEEHARRWMAQVSQSETIRGAHIETIGEHERRLDVIQYDPHRKAQRLVSHYGIDEAFEIAAARKEECFSTITSGGPVSYPGTRADFWADVECIMMGHTPDNLEHDERVSQWDKLVLDLARAS